MRCHHNHQNPISCSISLPLSKSIINRLLVINHLSGGGFIRGLLEESSDIRAMQDLLGDIKTHGGNCETNTEINVGNAGTVMRFLMAVLAITPGKWLITGTERMQKRPVKPLSGALQSLGADLTFANLPGYPPVHINGKQLLKGGAVQLDAGISSQFISALMMIGPMLQGGIAIELKGDIISGPYIHMTQLLMQKAGAEVSFEGNTLIIKQKEYAQFDFAALAEPDWSAAAFWFEVVALAPDAHVLLKGLQNESVQGDSVLPAIYAHLGVGSVFTDEGLLLTKSVQPPTKEFNYDFTACPDLAQAVIVTCAALGIQGRFTGLKTLRVKETDRIEALRNELVRLGYTVNVTGDQILLDGVISAATAGETPLMINCYDDHRMAMSFAPLALLHKNIALDDPDVVKKSYPGFWKDMAEAGFIVKSEK